MLFYRSEFVLTSVKKDRTALLSGRQLLGCLFFFLALLFFILTCPRQEAAAKDIHLLAAAGLRQPTDQLVMDFQKQTGHRVFVDYAGSGSLLARIRASGMGDLYMPGAFHYIQMLDQDGRMHSYKKIVAHVPVIGINPAKKEQIQSLKDLTAPGIRVALGDPKAMAFGRIAMDILEKAEIKDAVLNNVVVYGATVKQLALYVIQGDVDAAIIGRADAMQHKQDIHMVNIPSEYRHSETVAIALLKIAAKRPEAVQFLMFMSSTKAMATFQQFGFLALDQSEGCKDNP